RSSIPRSNLPGRLRFAATSSAVTHSHALRVSAGLRQRAIRSSAGGQLRSLPLNFMSVISHTGYAEAAGSEIAGGSSPLRARRATMAIREYRPGDTIDHSGVYRVVHGGNHTPEHEATILYGKRFPPCNRCGQEPRYYPVRLAPLIDESDDFE